jgi:hypothetical protein
MSGETIIINGDLVGRDNLTGRSSGKPGGVSVDDIIAAKMKAKLEEAEREAEEDTADNRQGGVTINGSVIKIGGRVVSGDLIVKK